MSDVMTWTVQIELDEHDGRTRAVARLRTGDTERLAGVGLARRNPVDRAVPLTGGELAAARALSELGHRLWDAAAEDSERLSGEGPRLVR